MVVHGAAKLLRCLSDAHGLIARSLISGGDAVEIVGIAADFEEEAEPPASATIVVVAGARMIMACVTRRRMKSPVRMRASDAPSREGYRRCPHGREIQAHGVTRASPSGGRPIP